MKAKAQIRGPQVQVKTLLLGKYQCIKNYVKEKKKATDYEQEDIILKLNQVVCPPWSGVTPEEIWGGQVEINRAYNVVEMAHKYTAEYGMQEVTLLEEFKHYVALFLDEEANKFPPP
jgi:hypothetical protein